MANICLIFGSDEGNTEAVAERIVARLGEEFVTVMDVSDVTQLTFTEYDQFILGIPTWDFGQIQSDWEEFWDDLKEVQFAGKKVALFGLGDQFGYGDFFLDAMGMLHDVVVANGAEIIGYWSADGYEFDASKALIEDRNEFVGLALDEDQQPELTAQRLNRWCKDIAVAFELGITPEDLDD